MSRNPYSNLSHEELLKLLAEKDAQLEKSSTEIRTLREEKQVQKELCCDNKESPETSIRIPHFRQ